MFSDTHHPQEPSPHADGAATRERKRVLQLVQEVKCCMASDNTLPVLELNISPHVGFYTEKLTPR